MLELKEFQRRGLEELEKYLTEASRTHDPKLAFERQAGRTYIPVPGLAEIPYVCLRVPTGGGKTLMASHTVGIAARSCVRRDRPLCLWLVPSNTIREQTIKALRNRSHPYREALESYFGGGVTAIEMDEALNVTRSTLEGETVIIVATLAALRVGNKDLRKVYESLGALQHHFSGLADAQWARLEKDESGVLAYSLANVFRLRRPLVIMDEAHRARTSLSFETLIRFKPSCILEFTATPEADHDPDKGRYRSNVLFEASVRDLKNESLIKLPIRLRTHPEWKQVIADAVAMVDELKEKAGEEQTETGEYIRPLALLQAQPVSQERATVTVSEIKKCLIEDCRILEREIATHTGKTRELEDLDILAKECPIRFIITVEALREGWDCAFAYVLGTVSEVSEAGAVEQLLGRVLRLPGARRKQTEALNAAYAYVRSPSFLKAAGKLEQGLVEDFGYSPWEAQGMIQRHSAAPSLPGFSTPAGILRVPVGTEPELTQLPDRLQPQVIFDRGSSEIVFLKAITSEEAAPVRAALQSEQDRKSFDSAFLKLAPKIPFRIPLLAIRNRHGQLDLFETDSLKAVPWNPASEESAFPPELFPDQDPTPEAGEIDVYTDRVAYRQYQTRQEAGQLLPESERDWPLQTLANTIAAQRPRKHLLPGQVGLYCAKVIGFLITARKLSLESLIRRRFELAAAIHERLDALQVVHNKRAWQLLLDGCDEGEAVIDAAQMFLTLNESDYDPFPRYVPGWIPQKHYFTSIGQMDTDEVDCAKHLEGHPQIRYWLRNLVKSAKAFRLPTSSDYFYPDFVAILNDGRILAVEYKGRQYDTSSDTLEKDLVGKLWADLSGGRCLFAMVIDKDFTLIDRAIQQAVSNQPKERKGMTLEILGRKEANPYVTHLPLYSLKVAAGELSGSQDAAEEGWVEVKGRKLDPQMFVAQVVGKSMEPRIPDGSYSIFRFDPVGSRQGKIVLAEYRGPADPETGGCYTVKRYRSKKEHEPDETPGNVEVSLEPSNPAFKPLVFGPQDAADVRVRAAWMELL